MAQETLSPPAAKEGRRGRPVSDNGRNLSDELIGAVEIGLRTKSHLDLTNREIASAAGTHAGMIHYYYDGKDGLINAALEQLTKDVSHTLLELKERFSQDCANATAIIMEAWLGLHDRHRGISSIALIESFRPYSPVWQSYRSQTARGTFAKMQEIIQVLVDKGHYKANVDVELAAFTVFSFAHSPMVIAKIMSNIGHNVDHLTGEAWFDQTVRMLESEYAADERSHH